MEPTTLRVINSTFSDFHPKLLLWNFEQPASSHPVVSRRLWGCVTQIINTSSQLSPVSAMILSYPGPFWWYLLRKPLLPMKSLDSVQPLPLLQVLSVLRVLAPEATNYYNPFHSWTQFPLLQDDEGWLLLLPRPSGLVSIADSLNVKVERRQLIHWVISALKPCCPKVGARLFSFVH